MYDDYRDALYGASEVLRAFKDQLTDPLRLARERLGGMESDFAAAKERLRAPELHLQPVWRTLQDEISLRRNAFEGVASFLAEREMVAQSIRDSVAQFGDNSPARSLREQIEASRSLSEQLVDVSQFSEHNLSLMDWQRFAGTFNHVEEVALRASNKTRELRLF
jgi:hypothetical protein